MDRVVDDLKLRAREVNSQKKRFVSDSEWIRIDQVQSQMFASTPDIWTGAVKSALSVVCKRHLQKAPQASRFTRVTRHLRCGGT